MAHPFLCSNPVRLSTLCNICKLCVRLQGIPRHELAQAVSAVVKLVDLSEKRHVTASKLSGGQKRKLSVGTYHQA